MSIQTPPSDNDIPEEETQEPLFTLSASTVLKSLPTTATQVLQQYARLPVAATATAAAGTTPSAPKVTIKIRAISSTPSLKQSTYRISGSQPFQVLVRFIRKQLKCKPSDSLFCYVNSSFAPGLDVPLINLLESFGTPSGSGGGNGSGPGTESDMVLQVSYCYTVAFG